MKSFSQSSHLIIHNKTAAHLKIKQRKNIDSSDNLNNFVSCDDAIKTEDIKEEESVDDPVECDNIDNEIKLEDIKEEILEDYLLMKR